MLVCVFEMQMSYASWSERYSRRNSVDHYGVDGLRLYFTWEYIHKMSDI